MKLPKDTEWPEVIDFHQTFQPQIFMRGVISLSRGCKIKITS
jgi:hypothetical protein